MCILKKPITIYICMGRAHYKGVFLDQGGCIAEIQKKLKVVN